MLPTFCVFATHSGEDLRQSLSLAPGRPHAVHLAAHGVAAAAEVRFDAEQVFEKGFQLGSRPALWLIGLRPALAVTVPLDHFPVHEYSLDAAHVR